jgi:catechol 2,3-dioxygenase-like lactoylglutathione lyase family enzyme
MADETTIPALPCKSIRDTVAFYRALGFDIPYEQTNPNPYAIVRRGGIELHFFSMRDYDPAQSYSTCIVLLSDAEQLYAEFKAALKQHYGRVLSTGIPRLTRLRVNSEGNRAFNIIDPGGNWIRFSERTPVEETETKSTSLSRAIKGAEFLADSKVDYPAAAAMLDKALAQNNAGTPPQRVQALVLRAALAITLNDTATAQNCLSDIQQIPLTDDERAALTDEFDRAEDITLQLSTNPL